jgi:flagellar M-ring protein FliF
MSVSVLLDSAVVTPAAVTTTWAPQISAAAGIQTARDGAQAVQVTAVTFDQKAAKAAQAQLNSASGSNPMFDLIKHVLTLLMIGLVLFFAWRAIKRAEANRVPLRVPLDLRELEAATAAALPAASLAGAAAAPAARRPSIEAPPPSLEGEITDLIERQPDEVAQTLRSWLADRRG